MTAISHPVIARAQTPRGLDRVMILAGDALVTWGRKRAAQRLTRAVASVNRDRFVAEQTSRRERARWESGAGRL